MAKSRTPDNLQLELRESPSDGTIDAVARIEHEAYRTRSRIDRLAAAIMRGAGTGTALFVHATWFSFWVSANLGVLPGIKPFDPFPFVFLATVVSLEAIFLTLFVLITQNRMSREADKRAQLDLQTYRRVCVWRAPLTRMLRSC